MNLRHSLVHSTRLLVALACVLAFAGCVDLAPQPDPSRFFTLSPPYLPAVPAERVEVQVAGLPYYAKSSRLALRKGDYEVEYFPFARWSGPLDLMLEMRLREHLEPVAAEIDLGSWRIHLEIIACEGNSDGLAAFGADYEIRQVGVVQPVARGRYLERVRWDPASGAEGLVACLGSLIDGFTDRLAEGMTGESDPG